MSIYESIIMEQKKQGNLGGLTAADKARLKEDKKRAKKYEKEEAKDEKKRDGDKTYYKVVVKNGIHIAPSDPNGLSDPYVKFGGSTKTTKITGKVYSTPVVKKSLSPTWDYEKTISVTGNEVWLTFELWDEDLMTDDYQGVGTVSIPVYGENHKIDMKRKDDHSHVYGQVYVSVKKVASKKPSKSKVDSNPLFANNMTC